MGYNPVIGQWVQRDPLGYVDGASLYQTVLSNPVNHVDPLGLDTDEEIIKEFKSLISWARTAGYNQAADNLEYFLSAKGGVKLMDWNWLRGNHEVVDAEKVNQERFRNQTIVKAAQDMKDGETKDVTDHWDRKLTGEGDLYYASGTSTLTSTGKFTLTRCKDVITVKGVVDHYWWDPYDWHPGLAAWVPGFGNIPDSHGAQLKNAGKAAEFFMESFWTQTVDGTIPANGGEAKLTWAAPGGGNSGLATSKAPAGGGGSGGGGGGGAPTSTGSGGGRR